MLHALPDLHRAGQRLTRPLERELDARSWRVRSDHLYELLGGLDRTPVDRQEPISSLHAGSLRRRVRPDEGHELSGGRG